MKEAAEQARAATVAGGTGGAAGDVTLATRNVAQAFNQAEEEEPQRTCSTGNDFEFLVETWTKPSRLVFMMFLCVFFCRSEIACCLMICSFIVC